MLTMSSPSDDLEALGATKEIFFTQLHKTKLKCDHLSNNRRDQERFFGVTDEAIPNLTKNRQKAQTAFEEVTKAINNITDRGKIEAFCSELAEKQGLFYRIYRGKINKHFIRTLPSDVHEKLKFKK